jgi:glycerophosphoryl diester phosphodiesterase
MITIIAGSRDNITYDDIEKAMKNCPWQVSEVVSGTARGADTFGEMWAMRNNIPIKRFPANWKKLGRRAGIERNKEMADYADALVAIWDGMSKGTQHMIKDAESKGLRVYIHTPNPVNDWFSY